MMSSRAMPINIASICQADHVAHIDAPGIVPKADGNRLAPAAAQDDQQADDHVAGASGRSSSQQDHRQAHSQGRTEWDDIRSRSGRRRRA